MATYPTPSLSLADSPVPKRTTNYFNKSIRRYVFDVVDELFDRVASEHNLNQAQLATRIGKDPAWVSRTLGAPGNWTLETIAELFVGMGIDPMKLFASASQIWDQSFPPKPTAADLAEAARPPDQRKPFSRPAVVSREKQEGSPAQQ